MKKSNLHRPEDPVHVPSTVPGPDLSFWNKENVSRTTPPSDVGSLPRVSGWWTESRYRNWSDRIQLVQYGFELVPVGSERVWYEPKLSVLKDITAGYDCI